MQPTAEDPAEIASEPVARPASPPPATTAESKEDRDRRLIELLGEVIRMSQAWVGALEAGDPFTAEKHEAQCLRIMDKFEARRKKASAKAASFEQTR
jgi:hypothetical protein